MNSSYVYKWTHILTSKWYIGSRTSKNAHPSDSYICSSKVVKPMILESPHEWSKTILAIGSPNDMILLEANLLSSLDAKNNPLSFNQHNGDGKFTSTGITPTTQHREKISRSKKGISRSEQDRTKISAALTGVKKHKSHCKNIRKARINYQTPSTTKDKISKTLSKPCTINGIIIYKSKKHLISELGWGKNGFAHPDFRYLTLQSK